MRKLFKKIRPYVLLIFVSMAIGKIAADLDSKYQVCLSETPPQKQQSITVNVDVVAPTYYERMINKTDAIHIPMKP